MFFGGDPDDSFNWLCDIWCGNVVHGQLARRFSVVDPHDCVGTDGHSAIVPRWYVGKGGAVYIVNVCSAQRGSGQHHGTRRVGAFADKHPIDILAGYLLNFSKQVLFALYHVHGYDNGNTQHHHNSKFPFDSANPQHPPQLGFVHHGFAGFEGVGVEGEGEFLLFLLGQFVCCRGWVCLVFFVLHV